MKGLGKVQEFSVMRHECLISQHECRLGMGSRLQCPLEMRNAINPTRSSFDVPRYTTGVSRSFFCPEPPALSLSSFCLWSLGSGA